MELEPDNPGFFFTAVRKLDEACCSFRVLIVGAMLESRETPYTDLK